MKVESDNGDVSGSTAIGNVFKIKYLNTPYTGSVTITNTANVCGFPGGAGTSSTDQSVSINTSSIPVIIEYCPDKAETRNGKLVFYDGTNVVATVHLSGTGVWPEMNFGTINQGQASIKSTEMISKLGNYTYSVAALDGYFFSTDNSSWSKSLTNVTSSKLYVKYQPHSTSTDGTQYVTITQNGQTLKVKVIGSKAKQTISTSQKIGLAKNSTLTLSNFTAAAGATASLSNSNLDYFLSADGTNWSTSISLPSNNKIYVKFQPSDNTTLHDGTLNIVSDGKTYQVTLDGDGQAHSVNKGSTTVLTYAMYGPESGDWYYFTNTSTSAHTYDNLILHSKVLVHIESNTPTGDFMLNNFTNSTFSTSDITISYSSTTNNGFRVGFFPLTATSASQQCTIKIKDDNGNGKTYTFTVTYSSVAKHEVNPGSVNVGKASAYTLFDMSTFRGFGHTANGTATVSSDGQFLFASRSDYNANPSTAWKTSLTVANGGSNGFYVKYVPTTGTSGETLKSLYVQDDALPTRRYEYHARVTGVATTIQVPAYVQQACTPQPFTMSNFTCEGNVQVDVSSGFEVGKSSSGSFSSQITIGPASTFYVRLTSTASIGNPTGTITLTDLKTSRTYVISLQGSVTLCPTSISAPSRIDFFSGDYSTHTMVGNNAYIKGSPSAINPDIAIIIPSSDDNNYLEVVEGNKLRLKQGVTVSSNRDCNLYARFSGNDKYAAADDQLFVVRIHPIHETNNDPTWKYNTSTGKWYVYQVEELDLGMVDVWDNSIDIYLPNVACNNNYFALKNTWIWSATCPFATTLYSDNATKSLVTIRGVTSMSYDDNHATFNIPSKGDDAKLFTQTNKYDDPSCASVLGNVHQKYAKIEIEVPQHYHKLKNSESVNFGNVQVGEVAFADIPLNGTNGLFKSFLTANGLSIAPASGCPSVFFMNPDNEGQSISLVPANYVLSPHNKIESYTHLVVDKEENYYIRFYFKPLAKQSYSGSFVLSDGDMSITISVSGSGDVSANEPQTIVWAQDLSRLEGPGSITLTAASTSGLPVTYTVSGSGFSVSGNTLSYTGAGSATVTASCAAGSNNGVNYSAASLSRAATAYAGKPTPGTCNSLSVSDPNAWRRNRVAPPYNMPYSMSPTAGVTWNGVGTPTQLNFRLNLTNCATADAKIYLNGTASTDIIDVYHNAGDFSINLESYDVPSGSTFYLSFDGTSARSGGDTTLSFSVTNITIDYTPDLNVLTSGTVGFGSQRVGQPGLTKNIQAAEYEGVKGVVSASITGTDADCFTLVTDLNPASIVADCEAAIAAYDVQFIPLRAGSLSANLTVTDPLGSSKNIPLTGTGIKRDVDLSWSYAASPITINTVGTGNSKSLTKTDNAFLYDQLRGTDAKLTIVPSYSVTNGTVEMIPAYAGQNIIVVNTDDDGYITSIEATGYGSGTAYVKASASSITSSHPLFNPLASSDEVTLTVNVQKVAPVITVDPESLTLTYPQDETAGQTVTASVSVHDDGITWSYSYTPSGRITVSQNSNVFTVKPLANLGDATLTVKTSATPIYNVGSVDVPITVSAGEIILTIDPDKLDLSSVTHDLVLDDVSGFVSSNYPDGMVNYTYSILGGNVISSMDPTGEKLTIKSIGTITLNVHAVAGTAVTDQSTGALNVRIGTLEFRPQGSDLTWGNTANWFPHRDRIPDAINFDVLIADAACTLNNTSASAACNALTISGSSGALTISHDCALDVVTSVANNRTASELVLKANINNAATLRFYSGSPLATVESCIKGTLSPQEGGHNNPAWQYRGFIGNNPSLNNWNVAICEWNETRNATNCWGTDVVYSPGGASFSGAAWKGYAMANYGTENAIYSYTTTLLPTTHHTYTLTRTSSGGTEEFPNCGVNLITNSWSAPIDITSSEVKFGENVEQTFYFYLTRSHLDWEYDKVGSFRVYPKNSGASIYQQASSSMIPASQSFLIRTNSHGDTLRIGHEAFAHQASGAMYAPEEKDHFNILKITLTIDSLKDDLYLLESENCSKDFDNGYDGTKIKESSRPQIYARNSFGCTAVNADSLMLGQIIGYQANKDGATCTITFDIDRLEDYKSLYLYDRLADRYTNILAGDSYSFTGSADGEGERFELVGQRYDDSEFVTIRDRRIEVVGKQALLSGFDNDSDNPVIIIDMKGNKVWSDKVSNGPWFNLPDMPAGTYIIYCEDVNNKFIWK